MTSIHVIHENQEWTAPLLERLRERDLPYRDWDASDGVVSLDESPPAGVYYSRMSASSHTRGHRYAAELTAQTLAWLERFDVRVVNGSSALRLELSKCIQHAELRRAGLRVPRTVAVANAVSGSEKGRASALQAAAAFEGPFITKHNRAGKGLGVRLFQSSDELADALTANAIEAPVDGILLLQEYIESPESVITRVEFIGGRLLYAVRVDTSSGFELCPADVCAVDLGLCPASETARAKFEIIEGFDHPLVPAYAQFLAEHQIEVAAFEFIEDAQRRAYTYDINTNTNYNAAAEVKAGASGMARLADFLGDELERVREREGSSRRVVSKSARNRPLGRSVDRGDRERAEVAEHV